MSLFVQGISDYNKGKEPKKADAEYLKGYTGIKHIKAMIKADKEQGK